MFLVGNIDNQAIRTILAVIIFVVLAVYWAHQLKTSKENWYKIGSASLLLGGLANATVLFANGCYMPSLNRIYYDGSVWVPMSQTTLYNFLGDRFVGFSIGDLLMVTGIVVLLMRLVWQKVISRPR